MNTRIQQFMIALMLIAFSVACSRPVAYFQKSQREDFKTTPVETVAVATPVESAQPDVQPVVAPSVTPVATPAEQVAEAKVAIKQLDALVSNNAKLAGSKSVQKRMNRVRTMLESATQKSELTQQTKTTATPHKMGLAERTLMKKIDKQIKNHLAPEKPMAKSMLTIGLIVGVIGLLLLLLNIASPLGIIALVVGLVLVLIDLLQ